MSAEEKKNRKMRDLCLEIEFYFHFNLEQKTKHINKL